MPVFSNIKSKTILAYSLNTLIKVRDEKRVFLISILEEDVMIDKINIMSS